MKFYGLTTIFVVIALFAISSSAQPPPNCFSNLAVLCAGGVGPKVKARDGQGECETYDSQCLVDQLNCIRYKNGEPFLTPC